MEGARIALTVDLRLKPLGGLLCGPRSRFVAISAGETVKVAHGHRSQSCQTIVMSPLRLLFVLVALVSLAGCTMHIPNDPDDTLNRVHSGELVVGISHSPPWTDISKPDAPSGTEVELVEDFATSIDADVTWHAGGEEELMTMLKEDQLDMIIGGITEKSGSS